MFFFLQFNQTAMQSKHFTDEELNQARADPRNAIMTTQYEKTAIKTTAENIKDINTVVTKANNLLADLHDEFHGTDEGDTQMRKRLIAECATCKALSTRCPHLFGILTKHSTYTNETTVANLVKIVQMRSLVDTNKMTKDNADKLVQAIAFNMAKKQ